ncbi:hypothetical protein [Stenotrophomonas maltophilia]|uniref:hypothetical protein n=1 Tax=Stenotrophomonas maltophilia TaxID=40324 RepID=UPI00201CFBC6|nr:hypothetical protein [Stenotrophomonas maltophilia]UQY95374.1 hypothetical protein LZ605_20015 [Stenotrophomonas maltophilia]
MKANAMLVELHDGAEAARRDQVIALAREVNADFQVIHDEMASILARSNFALAA